VIFRVLTQAERPIGGAAVHSEGAIRGHTDERGELVLRFAVGESLYAHATADGYQPSLTVSADITSDHERWTFYLEPLQGGSVATEAVGGQLEHRP
jgi:hypothetical protein